MLVPESTPSPPRFSGNVETMLTPGALKVGWPKRSRVGP